MAPNLSRRLLPIAGIALLLAALGSRETQAHKGITSFYNYNKDTYPIFVDLCSRCHFEGGPAPMTLSRYKDDTGSGASAWGQSIRDYLVSEHMPPWYVDPLGPAMKGGYQLTPRQLDRMITWAAGGTPEGDAEAKPKPIVPPNEWPHGQPDLKLQMEAEHALGPGKLEDTKEFVLDTGLKEARWVKGVDLLPGTRSMVRSATIAIDQGPLLSVWVPGGDPIEAPDGVAFRLPAGARIRLEIFYRKSYLDEQNTVSDRSTVGLYFAAPPAGGREIQSFDINAPSAENLEARAISGELKGAARVVGIRPSLDQPYASIKVEAVAPNGTRAPLLWLRAPRPEWRRRYWLAEPKDLPSGTRIEVSVAPFPEDAELPRSVKTYPLQIALDYVPR